MGADGLMHIMETSNVGNVRTITSLKFARFQRVAAIATRKRLILCHMITFVG